MIAGRRTAVPYRGQPNRARHEEADPPQCSLTATAVSADAPPVPELEQASMGDIIDTLAGGQRRRYGTHPRLSRAHCTPSTAAGRCSTPCASSIPTRLRSRGSSTASSPSAKRPLAGVPILVKDNIATGDRQPTTAAGALALRGRARQKKRDRRQAAAERRRGDPGQGEPDGVRQHVRDRHALGLLVAGRPGEEPYALALLDDHTAIPLVSPGGSSSGSASRRGGRTVRGLDRHRDLGLAAVSGQPERPRHREADRRADQPGRHPADLAQPGHRGADDAHGARRGDCCSTCWRPRTRAIRRRSGGGGPADYTTGLARDAMKGARIGIPAIPPTR